MAANCSKPKRYHAGNWLPPAVASVKRVKGQGTGAAETDLLCYDHLVNRLSYWESFWEVTPIPDQAEDCEKAITQAARWRRKED